MEAIRYQENSSDHKVRKGHREVKVASLTFANLTRNKRRTAVTVLTMGLSCVFFICVSAVLSSISVEDMARRSIPKGDFRISWIIPTTTGNIPKTILTVLYSRNILTTPSFPSYFP